MQSKIDETITPSTSSQQPVLAASEKPTLSVLPSFNDAMNVFTLASITGAAVVGVSNPLRWWTACIVSGQQISFKNMTPLGVISTVYSGAKSAWNSSLLRGSVNVNARTKHEQGKLEAAEEAVIEESQLIHPKYAPIFYGVGLEVSLTKYSDTKSSFEVFGLRYPRTVPNILTTLRFGLPSTMLMSGMGFYAALDMQQYYLSSLPVNSFTAGALSGLTLTGLTLPIAGLYDYRIKTVTVDGTGRLHMPNFWVSMQSLGEELRADYKGTLQKIYPNIIKQGVVRGLRTAGVLATVASVIEAVGPKPYDDIQRQVEKSQVIASIYGFFKPAPPELGKTSAPVDTNKPGGPTAGV